MPKKSQRDPIGVYMRKSHAERRIQPGTKCACGESRPEALISDSDPIICGACRRKKNGMSVTDNHHVAGEANHPGTLRIFVNDHWSELNVAQKDWPKETIENPYGSPLLAAAGCIRGARDTIAYLIETFLLWIAVFLEKLDSFLTNELGIKWWVNSEVKEFAPKQSV